MARFQCQRVTCVGLAAVCLVASLPVAAAPQRWPYLFDASLAADPSGTANYSQQGESALALLPVERMTTLQTGDTTLWFFPEMASQLERARTSGPGVMAWPVTSEMCAQHAAFVVPALMVDAATSCAASAQDITSTVASLGGCLLTEQPERYVLSYAPYDRARVDALTNGSMEDLIGLVGEAVSHGDVPEGLLAPEFVTTLRHVLAKIRTPALLARLQQDLDALTALQGRQVNAGSCFQGGLDVTFASLRAEVQQAITTLNQWKTEGEAEAAREELRLATRSRVRNALPFPSLTEEERRFTAFWLGGLYWRMRGGGLMPLGSTQNARTYFLLRPFKQIGSMCAAQDGVDAATRIYGGIFDGWGEWMDMGRTPGGGDKYWDLVGMTKRGLHQVDAAPLSSAADFLANRSYDVMDLNVGGLDMGPCYFRVWESMPDFRFMGTDIPPYSSFVEAPTAIGEFCAGASIALGFASALLNGKATGMPPTCTVACNGAVCGDDGCGGSCGGCTAGLQCSGGQCVMGGVSSSTSTGPMPSSGVPMDVASSSGVVLVSSSSVASSVSPVGSSSAGPSSLAVRGSSSSHVSASSGDDGGEDAVAPACACANTGVSAPRMWLAAALVLLGARRRVPRCG